MKRLFFILALLFAMQISAQTEITIGDTASSQVANNLPLTTNYKYSYSQSVYKRSELVAGEISNISYYFTGEYFSSGTISIYMKEISDSTLSGFVSSTGFVQVYSGSLTLTNGWTTFEFPETFEYSGQNNLVVAVIRSDNNFYTGYGFKVSPSDSCSIVRCSDLEPYDLTSTHGYGSPITKRPVTKFEINPATDYCYPPENLSAYVSSTDVATISWNRGSETSSVFALAYKTDTDEDWILESDGINDTTYLLTSLLPYTKYYVKVWTICPLSNSFQREISFITQPNESCFIYLTYEEDFDDLENLSSWRYTHHGENRWVVGPAVNNTRNLDGSFTQGNALYISNDGGLTNSYNYSAGSVSHFSTLIEILDSVYYGISFDYKLVGQNYADNLSVYLVPVYTELTSSTFGFTAIGTINNSTNTWRRFEAEIPQSVTPGIYQLVFTWQNNNYMGENPPAAIDNLKVQASTCAIPEEFSGMITDVDGNASMAVTINDTINQAASYIVEYRLAGETIWDTIQEESPVLIPYLPYSSIIEYRVVASCATGNVSMPSSIATIATPCGLTDEYPYKEYFEANVISIQNNSEQYCWKTINGANQSSKWSWSNVGGIKNSGTLNYQYYNYDTENFCDDWVISPAFALNGNQRLNFQYKMSFESQSEYKPKIDIYLYNTDIVDYSSPEDTIYCEYLTTIYDSTLTATKWKMAELLLNDYVGNYRIALVIREATQGFCVDNFSVSDIPDCFEVYGLDVKPYSGTSVAINYETDNIFGSGVAIAYAPETVSQNFEPDNAEVEIILSDEELPYILEGLEPGTTYVFAASQLCGGEWSDTAKASLPMVYPVPFLFDLDTEEATPEMYFYASNSSNKWFVGGSHNSSFEGDTLPGRALYITNDNGSSASYYPSFGNNYQAYLNVEFVPGAEYELFFDWKCQGNGTSDFLKVYLVPFGSQISEDYAITGPLNLSTQWQREQIILPAHRYNGGYQLIFDFKINSYSDQYRLPAVVDNIRIDINDCARIVDLGLAVEETENSPNLVVDLLDQFNTNASYVLRYKEANELLYREITGLTRTSFPYILSDSIEYQKIYQLQIGVICQQGDAPYFNDEVFSIMTPCTILPTPLEVNFEENILEEQYCWTRYNGLTSLYDTTYTADLSPNSSWEISDVVLDGVVSKRLYANLGGSDLKDWVVTPPINLGNDSIIKQIVFDLATRKTYNDEVTQCGDDDKFIVFYSTDNGESWDIHNAVVFKNNDADTLHNLNTLSNQSMPVNIKLVDENNQPITGLLKIAFYVESTVADAYNTLCIDNLWVKEWTDCQAPHNLQVAPESVRSNLAIVNFTTLDNNAEYFEYAVVEGECNNFDTLPTMYSSETSFALLNLEEETFYTVAIRSVCQEEVYSDWNTTTFTTLREPKPIPFETNFSDSVKWYSINNGLTTNAWSIGSATSVDTNGMAAYLSNDGGISYNASFVEDNTIAYLYQDISFGETVNNFELFFDWKCIGRFGNNQDLGGLRVYITDIAPLPTSQLPNNPIAVLNSAEQWQSERIFLGNIIGDKRLVFATYGYNISSETLTPAAIDNVRLIVSPCSKVEEIDVLNVTSNSIELAWSETNADNYIVYYRDEYSSEYLTMTTTDNYAILSNLGGATRYYIKIQGFCGENSSLISDEIISATSSEIATLPYSCDFEGVGANGWIIKNGNSQNRWWVGQSDSHPNSSLFITGENGSSTNLNPSVQSVIIAEKHFQLGQRDSLRISFDVKIAGSHWNYLKVFFLPENVNFEPSLVINDFATQDYSQYILISNMQDGVGDGYIINNIAQTQNMSITIPTPYNEVRKLVFVWVNHGGYTAIQSAVIDNVVVEEVGDIITCIKPVANSVVANNVLQTSAFISWQDDNETHNAWNVYYKAENESVFQSATAIDQPSITLENLNPYTLYYVYVKTNCGGEESYPTDTITFHTHCEAITDYPYYADFEAEDLSCWIMDKERENNWVVLSNHQLYYDATEFNSVMIYSPIFNLISLPNPTLKIRYGISGITNSSYGLKIYYRENQGDEWSVLREYLGSEAGVLFDRISLHHISSNYQIAFQAIGKAPLDIFVDNISIISASDEDGVALTDVENNGELKTNIYPNPASAQATLQVEGLTQDAKVVISDLQGRILSEGEMKASATTYTLDLSNLASGVYYIRIVTDAAISTQKLIVE